MSDELEEFVENIKERSFWVRILCMVAFAVAVYIIIVPMILVLSIVQSVFTLLNGQTNANLKYFSATLALYVIQIIEFLTYLSEAKPFPFSDLPEVEDDSLQEESASTAAAEKKPAVKKAAKKKAAKKSPKTTKKPEADASETPEGS
tara:strand:+ start:14690 stop:15130 length:441 start_codon:yes stop_codon:yes gene_type:complete